MVSTPSWWSFCATLLRWCPMRELSCSDIPGMGSSTKAARASDMDKRKARLMRLIRPGRAPRLPRLPHSAGQFSAWDAATLPRRPAISCHCKSSCRTAQTPAATPVARASRYPFGSASRWSARRVASAMIVIDGFTDSVRGTTEPSPTNSRLDVVHSARAVTARACRDRSPSGSCLAGGCETGPVRSDPLRPGASGTSGANVQRAPTLCSAP